MFCSVQSLSHVWLFATPWTAARQGSLFFTNSWSLDKLMSIELVIPSNHLILCQPLSSCLQSCPVTGSFLMSQFFISVGQSIGGSISASVLAMNIQDWFPLGWLDGSPCSPRDSQESCPTPQFKTINSSLLTILYSATVTSIHDIHPVGHFTWCTLHISYISKVTIYSLYILLSRIGTSQLCHVQFWLLLLDLHTNFSEGR